MSFESLDFEAKALAPTQQLLQQAYVQLGGLYLQIREAIIDFHSIIAIAAQQIYDQPVATTQLWYAKLAETSNELYARLVDQVLPEAQENYNQLLAGFTDFGSESRQVLQTFIDNPENVSAHTIESINSLVSETVNVTAEQLSELQSQSAAIIGMLVEQPIVTLETFSMELLSALLDRYFELVSSLLISI